MLWYLKVKLLALLLGTTARLHEQKDRTHRGRLPDHPAAVSLLLRSAGYQIVEACDGREGVEAFRAHPEVAMVLCDLNMPNMNGIEFLETVKGEAEKPPVPWSCLTTDGSPDVVTRARRAGPRPGS